MPASLLTQRAAFLSSIASKQFAHRKSNVVVNFSGAFVLWGAHAPRVLAIAPSRSRTSCPLSVSGSRTGWRFSEGAETSTRAAPKPRTGITDSGYNGPWRSAKIFADVAYTPAGNHRHGYPPPSECHGGLIGTGLGSGCAYSIGVGRMAVATDGIGVETVIQGGGDTRVVAVNIDHVRSRAAPGEVHRWRLSSYGWASEKS